MDFYNIVTECSESFNAANKEITSACNDLKKNWEGPASLKFFPKIEEVKEILKILKNQISLFEAAGNQIKVLEEVIKNLKTKKEQLVGLEEPNANLSAEVRSLEKQKKDLIKEIEEYFDTISSLKAGSFFIDLNISLGKDTIAKANNVNKTTKESSKNKADNDSKNIENDEVSTIKKSEDVDYSQKVGTVISNSSSYNNSATKGQCVWYVRGRALEKLGKDTGAVGHGNQMALNCSEKAKLAATKENIKDDIIVSYRYGTSTAGQKYGHVIYIEKVDGDKVYYTECKSGGKAAGTLKETTKDDIINGTVGCGTSVVGFIDVNKL